MSGSNTNRSAIDNMPFYNTPNPHTYTSGLPLMRGRTAWACYRKLNKWIKTSKDKEGNKNKILLPYRILEIRIISVSDMNHILRVTLPVSWYLPDSHVLNHLNKIHPAIFKIKRPATLPNFFRSFFLSLFLLLFYFYTLTVASDEYWIFSFLIRLSCILLYLCA